MEIASARRVRTKRKLENIPEFRNHLERENITFSQFEKRQQISIPGIDAALDELAFAYRRLKLKFASR